MFEKEPPSISSVNMKTRVDLKHAMELTGRHIFNYQSKDANYRSYWSIAGSQYRYDLRLWWTTFNLGRWWDTLLRLEETIDFAIPRHLEEAMLQNLKLAFDNPDSLFFEPLNVKLTPHFELHSCGEGLLALTGLINHRNNNWARSQGHLMIKSLLIYLNEDGTWNYDKMKYGKQVGQGRSKESTWSHGRMLEALVCFYKATKDPIALELARRIANYHFENTTNPDGSFNDASDANQSHSYLGTLRGLLLFGELTDQHQYIERVYKTYKNTVLKSMISKSGLIPHNIGGDGNWEPTSAGDTALLALWLAARHGYTELLDDVERIVRAKIIPTQITSSPPTKPMNKIDNPEMYQYDDITNRIIGGFSSTGYAAWGKGAISDYAFAVAHTLSDIYNHIVVRGTDGTKVNLHFDYEDEKIQITSVRKDSATVLINKKVKENLWLRIPRWVDRDSINITISDASADYLTMGDYVIVPEKFLPGRVILTYSLPINIEKETHGGIEFEYLWRGDEIIGVYPNSDVYPLYPTYVSSERGKIIEKERKGNLALNSRATASSFLEINGVDIGNPSHAIDNWEGNFWYSAECPTEDTPQWLQVDLGKSYSIRKIVLDCRYDFDFNYPFKFRIDVSRDGSAFETIEKIDDNEKIGKRSFEFILDKAFNARYIRYVVSKVPDNLLASVRKVHIY